MNKSSRWLAAVAAVAAHGLALAQTQGNPGFTTSYSDAGADADADGHRGGS